VAAGCAAPAVAPSAAAPTLPTSASVGGANIVAISPPGQQCCPKQTLPQFLGVIGACEGIKELISRLRNRLGSIWPGLEAKPELLAITDPANLESDNPAVAAAASVKAEEDAAAQKAKAIAYLASVGCAGCYPGIEDALLAALDDCTELVRFETAKALRSTALMPCKNCCRSACCGPKIREKLTKLAYETDAQGCYLESSDRVRRMARLALANCTCVPDKPGQPPTRLPEEGPGPEDIPPPTPEPTPTPATASVLHQRVTGSSQAIAYPVTSASQNFVRPTSYEEAITAYGSRTQTEPATPLLVAWEMWTARPGSFASRTDAASAMTLTRAQVMSSQPGMVLPREVSRSVFDWADPSANRSPALARALATTPIGGVSGVIEDQSGWHIVRVLGRRPAPPPTAAIGTVQPISYASPAAPLTSTNPGTPRIVALRQPDCNCK
jgi:PPIC-type PPIASE domain